MANEIKIYNENSTVKIKKTRIWINLLKEGRNDSERKDNWNSYLYTHYHSMLHSNASRYDEILKLGITKLPKIRGYSSHRNLDSREVFGKENGGWPKWPTDFPSPPDSLVDFSNVIFPENISFAGRLLIGADFSNSIFVGEVDFRDAVFIGKTNFVGANFMRNQSGNSSVQFQDSVFCDPVDFEGAVLPANTNLNNTNFKSLFLFQKVTFETNNGLVNFKNSVFEEETSFSDTIFDINTEFSDAIFNYRTSFDGTVFRKGVYFNNSKFQNSITFRMTSFGRPPQFFNTSVHENVNFNGIDWSGAEYSYSHIHGKTKGHDFIVKEVENAISAWDRLALIMSEQEKPWERHSFFRLKMRAQRQIERNIIARFSNWVFDKTSDYGWSIARSFFYWCLHIFLGTFSLFIVPYFQDTLGYGDKIWLILWYSFLASFSNAHSFLRLGSPNGDLEKYVSKLEPVINEEWLSTVGTFQSILGPILLFLVLLTLRNRFRIG